jgi:hypothetical protein
MDVGGAGRLLEASEAPVHVERMRELSVTPRFTVEQILSGRLDAPERGPGPGGGIR